jgi:hypothetical protein
MVRHYCDGCGAEVTADNGVVGMKELTVEMEGTKLSIAVEVGTMKMRDGSESPHPAVCAGCIAKRFAQWAVDVAE